MQIPGCVLQGFSNGLFLLALLILVGSVVSAPVWHMIYHWYVLGSRAGPVILAHKQEQPPHELLPIVSMNPHGRGSWHNYHEDPLSFLNMALVPSMLMVAYMM